MFGWFSKRKEYDRPDWLQQYLSLDFNAPSKLPLEEAIFIVLDCETSGLKMTDKIVTIGALRCTSKRLLVNEVLDQRFSNVAVGPSSEIHGELSNLAVGEDEEPLLRELISFLTNSVIIGHNIAFDIQMINNMLGSRYGVKLKNKVLDTAQLVMRLDPVFYERTVGGKSMLHLDDLCDQYEIQIENRHTALGDAYLTAQLFQRVTYHLKKRGVETVGQLLR